MNQHQLFSFPHTCWIKIEVLHLLERLRTIAPSNVIRITFVGSITLVVVIAIVHGCLEAFLLKWYLYK